MILAQNRKASFNYTLESPIEAGIALLGPEVKAVRAHKCSLVDAFVCQNDDGIFVLRNAHIAPSNLHPSQNFATRRDRPLLLNSREARRLIGRIQREGITIIPTSIYCKLKWIKISICVAQGKKKFDKRQSEKEKEWARSKQKALRAYR